MTSRVVMPKRHVWSLVEAREALERLVGQAQDWTVLDSYLVRYIAAPEQRPTVIASAFSASLELVREGRLELRQDGAFAPLWVRGLTPEPEPAEILMSRWTSRMSAVARKISVDVATAPDHGEALRIAEALLFAAREPLAGAGACRPAAGGQRRRRGARRPCRASTPIAASTSSRSPANGRSAPPATCPSCSRATSSSRASCRAPRWRRSPSSPTTSR